MSPLRIGVVGANAERGWARDAHLVALKALPGVEVQAVSARTQAIADAAAPLFGAKTAYADSLTLTRDPDVDVVAVTVKVPEHRAIVLSALKAGKHVYCEWPLGRDLAEAEEMAQAARAGTGHVAIGLQALHAPAVRQATALVQAGAIGRPLHLRVVSPTGGWGAAAPDFYAYLQDRRNGATLTTIPGGHTLAAMEAVAGALAEVSAIESTFTPKMKVLGGERTVERTSPDHILVLARHASGCVSTLEVVGGALDTPFVFELQGSDGQLAITGGHAGGFQAGELVLHAPEGVEPPPPVRYPGLPAQSVNVAEAWAAFLEDIAAGTRTVPDFDTAVALTRTLDAIDAAADKGLAVTLPGRPAHA